MKVFSCLLVVCHNLTLFFIDEVIDDKVTEPHSESIRAGFEREQFHVLSSESVYIQDSICDEASGSSSFLDLKPLKVSDISAFCLQLNNITNSNSHSFVLFFLFVSQLLNLINGIMYGHVMHVQLHGLQHL